MSRGSEYTNPQGSNDNAQAGGVSFALKKYERKFQKPLDKSAQICYNIYTERARKQAPMVESESKTDEHQTP